RCAPRGPPAPPPGAPEPRLAPGEPVLRALLLAAELRLLLVQPGEARGELVGCDRALPPDAPERRGHGLRVAFRQRALALQEGDAAAQKLLLELGAAALELGRPEQAARSGRGG